MKSWTRDQEPGPSGSSEPSGGRDRILRGFDRRTGLLTAARAVANEPVPGGVAFGHAVGYALLLTFVLQAATGIALAAVYSPSVSSAWGSVYYIQHEMTLGWLVRGLHHHGSSALVVLTVLHLGQVFLRAAYRAPREPTWLLGVLLFLLVLADGLTGYLLPWDQKGYWSTQVATGLVGSVPGGAILQEVLQGGPDYGTLTLARFFVLHAFLVPLSIALLLVSHVRLYRLHGPAEPGRGRHAGSDRVLDPAPAAGPRADAAPVPGPRAGTAGEHATFWPHQVLRDLLLFGVVLAVLVALSILIGVDLDAPADPASNYDARPEWYFLFLFELLKYFEGSLAFLGTVVLPGLTVAFLFAVPFLDRPFRRGPAALTAGAGGGPRTGPPALPDRRPSYRVAIPMCVLAGGVAVLTTLAVRSDSRDEAHLAARETARREADRAVALARLGGIDASGTVVLLEGEKLFHEKGCAHCHLPSSSPRVPGSPEPIPAPPLERWGTPDRIEAFLAAPDDFFGRTPLAGAMEPFAGTAQERRTLARWLASLSGRHPADLPTRTRGESLFSESGCADCHNSPTLSPRDKGWDPTAIGPDLPGYASYEWTRSLLLAPSHPSFFGGALTEADDARAMPSFQDLSPTELHLLTTYLLSPALESHPSTTSRPVPASRPSNASAPD